jgi:DNA helicase HerA-like ATPase
MIAMSMAAPLKAISVDDLERALDDYESSAVPGGGKSHFVAFLLSRSRPLHERPEGGAETIVFFDPSVGSGMMQLFALLLRRVQREGERFERLIEVLMPNEPVPESAVVEQARRNAEARTAFLKEVPTATSADVAELSGSRARNKAALAGGWRKRGKVFAISASGQLRFPLFQFDREGQPKRELAELLAVLQEQGLSGWEIALWFSGANERLDGKRPLDLLESEPERVLDAASQLSEIPW